VGQEFDPMIQLKRAYEPVSLDDGLRILVERLWPRGVSKQKAKIDLWLKDLDPAPRKKWPTSRLKKSAKFS
jgi:uncharacterized protein YeaO (DUF488 family)